MTFICGAGLTSKPKIPSTLQEENMLSLAGKCRVFLRGKQEVAYHTRRLLLLLSKRKHEKNEKTRAEPRRKVQDIFTREARASVHTRRLLLSKRKHAKHEQTRATSNVNRRTWAHQTTTMEGNRAGSNSTNDYSSSYRNIIRKLAGGKEKRNATGGNRRR